MSAPGYWMHETTGVLRPAIEAHLAGGTMTDEQIAAMRAYLRQWIAAPSWDGDEVVDQLRARVDGLTSRSEISVWLLDAYELGIDPL